MQFIIGIVVVFVSILGSFALIGGNLLALNQPGEFGIILGSALGAFIIANPVYIVKQVVRDFKLLFSRNKYDKEYFMSLLIMIFNLLKIIRSQGINTIENDIDNPHESNVFKEYPNVLTNSNLILFLCDHLRVISMGVDNHHALEDLIIEEIETNDRELDNAESAITNLSDGLPALGIIAAVLGVIKTMSSLDQPPQVIGKLIAGALVGTFLGIFFSYCIFYPLGQFIHKIHTEDFHYMICIKNALVSHMKGNSPAISIEIARKSLPDRLRPDFHDLESKLYS